MNEIEIIEQLPDPPVASSYDATEQLSCPHCKNRTFFIYTGIYYTGAACAHCGYFADVHTG